MQEERSIKDLLGRMLDRYDLSDKMNETNLWNKWDELMGKTIAKNTKRLYVKNKTLYLVLDSPSLKNDLIFYEKTIIEKVNQFVKTELINAVKIK
jgi:predicted nucleic acid-binding Zn ribbon protein